MSEFRFSDKEAEYLNVIRVFRSKNPKVSFRTVEWMESCNEENEILECPDDFHGPFSFWIREEREKFGGMLEVEDFQLEHLH